MMDLKPNENNKVSPYFAMFLVHKMQIGVGILGFERVIAKDAEYDAWISVLIAGISVNVILWMCFRMLHKDGNDIISIHKYLFGRWFGGGLSVILFIYFLSVVITILRTYTEVIQVWMFPGVNVLMLMVIFALLVYNLVTGGFRVVTGAAFLGVLISLPLLLLKYFPLKYADFTNLMPLFDHSVKELLLSAKAMTLNYLGFEFLLMYYPFLNEPRKAEKWAHFGAIFSTIIYLISTLVSFAYYSQDQLKHSVWATLTLWKIVDLPFVERFEYVGIAIWLFAVIPNVCLGVWAVSRGMKRIFAVNQRKSLVYILGITVLACTWFQTRQAVDQLNSMVSRFGFWIIYAYIPLLFILFMVVHKVRNKTK
ncbi:GerAB/ArcD/ProY family transporter [Bacillus sp. V59.32b]|uniref:GerAB/ArcD/ProY family transporter n=1 Tax=Bacillus sp. V59.32b TaxID=1758642 RepID=UPI000E3E22FA|nr:GerAB/ArcD/ProY family transporter [Bacillus sp. V59.32b]RFU69825.1 spore gernimation protein GerB [Bacillus sp. V59.32b]